MAALSWSFRTTDFIAGPFKIDGFRVCEELDDDLLPVSPGVDMPPDTPQACVWFKYSSARRGDMLGIDVYLNGRMIQRETVKLSAPEGVRAFYLLKEDGGALDPGFYSVTISCNGRERLTENFSIAASSGDADLGNVVIWN
jgi:hypothetical protein